MAASSKGRAIAEFLGRRALNQISASAARFNDSAFLASSLRRAARFSSSYEKNLDDQVGPSVVPDDVVESKSDKYWGPHPQTGVFGPADRSGVGDLAGSLRSVPASTDGPSSSVLDQTAWFRPLEDVEKPPPVA